MAETKSRINNNTTITSLKVGAWEKNQIRKVHKDKRKIHGVME